MFDFASASMLPCHQHSGGGVEVEFPPAVGKLLGSVGCDGREVEKPDSKGSVFAEKGDGRFAARSQ